MTNEAKLPLFVLCLLKLLFRIECGMSIKDCLRPLWKQTFGRLESQFLRELGNAVGITCESLLDVGCGFNSPVQYLQYRPKRMVGVDGFLPVIEQSRAKAIHDEYRQLSLIEIEDVFGPKSFECVLALDVIEHLVEADAIKLIGQMERVARKKVIVYTPNGYLPQGMEFGNPYQRHLSGWSVKTMEAMGYNVIGVHGFKFLRGYMARIKWHPHRFWLMISLLSQFITRNHPGRAFQILCVKEIQQQGS